MLQARQVYKDAIAAISALGDGESETLRRIYWVAAVSLLRASMHILQKVDAANDPELAKSVEEAWLKLKRSKPEPEIFWGFIEQERNLILKQYELNADLEDSFLLMQDGSYFEMQDGSRLALQNFLQIIEGPFKGQDGRDVLINASEWVDRYIQKFE